MPTKPHKPLEPAVAKLVENISTLCEWRNWSRDQLSREAHIHKSTLYRIEKGQQRPNGHTVDSVAKALGVTAKELWGDVAQLDTSIGPGRQNFSRRMAIRNQTMNALAMTALRYRTPPATILEAAPLLFCLAAEASLRKRSERLSDVLTKIEDVGNASKDFPHIPRSGFFHWYEAFDVESASIAKRDLFARHVENAEIHEDDDGSYESDEQNPFVQYLKDWAAELDAGIEISSWPFWAGPDYVVGRDQALAFVGGNEAAAQAIMLGTAPVNLMNRDLGTNATPETRADWAIKRAEEHKAKVDAWEADLLANALADIEDVSEDEEDLE